MTRVGFVSLLLDFENELIDKRVISNINSKFELPYCFIKETHKNRLDSVIENINWADKNGVNLLLFPGWTLYQPADLKKVAKHVGKNLHVVLELCEGANEFRNSINENRKNFQSSQFFDDSGVFILNSNKVISGPIFQLFSEGLKYLKQKRAKGFMQQLNSEFLRDSVWDYRNEEDEYKGFAQGRWIDLDNHGKFLLILCGEANLTNDKKGTWLEIAKQNGFDQIDYSKAKAILNPAHTPSSKYMVDKRFAWSKLTGIPLITCSNIDGVVKSPS